MIVCDVGDARHGVRVVGRRDRLGDTGRHTRSDGTTRAENLVVGPTENWPAGRTAALLLFEYEKAHWVGMRGDRS